METTGRIFDIQRYSLHDGSGVRTIVFLKGCHLRCKWCCNPESQKFDIEMMNGQTIGRDVTVAEVMAAVEKDRHYYRRSGGGLTLSGGEALAQPEFAYELLKAANESGIHTAVESTAMVEFSTIEKMLPYLDQFLMDIKHMNPTKHKEFTGKDNTLALQNARQIKGTELIIRVPVIPGFNASEAEITDIAKFAAEVGVKEIHLLPYHRYGESKYAALGRTYPMGDTRTPTENEMLNFKAAAEKYVECILEGGK